MLVCYCGEISLELLGVLCSCVYVCLFIAFFYDYFIWFLTYLSFNFAFFFCFTHFLVCFCMFVDVGKRRQVIPPFFVLFCFFLFRYRSVCLSQLKLKLCFLLFIFNLPTKITITLIYNYYILFLFRFAPKSLYFRFLRDFPLSFKCVNDLCCFLHALYVCMYVCVCCFCCYG